MREIKYRRVYQNKKTKEVKFKEFCITEDMDELQMIPPDCNYPGYDLIGQDLYILDGTDGERIYENDVVLQNTYVNEKSNLFPHKETRLWIKPEKKSNCGCCGYVYGWRFGDVDLCNKSHSLKKDGTKYEPNNT